MFLPFLHCRENPLYFHLFLHKSTFIGDVPKDLSRIDAFSHLFSIITGSLNAFLFNKFPIPYLWYYTKHIHGERVFTRWAFFPALLYASRFATFSLFLLTAYLCIYFFHDGLLIAGLGCRLGSALGFSFLKRRCGIKR